MFTKTNLKISLTHLSSRKKQTLIAMLSVTFGVSMYIFMNSFMGGVNKAQTEMSFTSLAHIRIFNDIDTEVKPLIKQNDNLLINLRNAKAIQYTEGITNVDQLTNKLKNYPKLSCYTTQVNLSGTFRNGSIKQTGTLSGVDVINEDKLFNMKEYITEGNWDELSISNTHIILGKGLANKLSLQINNNVTIITSDNISKNYKIVGIIETGSPNVDDSKAYIRKSSALQLVSKNKSYATDIQINISDYNNALEIAKPLKKITKYKVESWQEGNKQLVSANSLRNIIAIAVSLVIIIVAGFGIYNIMNMTVTEKIKEIAILKALGFDGNDVIDIFLSQTIIIGIFGGTTGVLLGFFIAKLTSKVPFKMMTLKTLPITFEVSDYIFAFGIGFIITIIAGYLPARKASKVDPIEIIRG